MSKIFSETNEIHLYEGLKAIYGTTGYRLYSDGLGFNEYMHYIPGKGICYEDGALIGEDYIDAFNFLARLGWIEGKKFYLVRV